MPRNIALLRGINLGSKRRVAMADLRALLEALGYTDVRTVLASGNAIFTGLASRKQLEVALQERFAGFSRSEEMIRYWGMIPLRPLVLVGLPNASTDAYSDPDGARRTIRNDTGRFAPAPSVNVRVVART